MEVTADSTIATDNEGSSHSKATEHSRVRITTALVLTVVYLTIRNYPPTAHFHSGTFRGDPVYTSADYARNRTKREGTREDGQEMERNCPHQRPNRRANVSDLAPTRGSEFIENRTVRCPPIFPAVYFERRRFIYTRNGRRY